MNTLQTGDLQRFFNELSKKGNMTKRGDLLLPENLIEGVRLPKAPKSEMRVLSREEQRR